MAPFLKPLVGGLALVAVCALGLGYVRGLGEKNAELSAQVARLETALAAQESVVVALSGSLDRWESAQDSLGLTMQEMQEIGHEASSDIQRLWRLFARMDLESMPRASADSLVNHVSDGLWSEFDAATAGRGYGGREPATADSATAPEPSPH